MIWRDRHLKRLALAAAGMILGAHLLLALLGQVNPFDPVNDIRHKLAAVTQDSAPPVLTQQRLRHITDGDSRGGGHLHGSGTPCKSEFPASWTREKIARDIPLLAANDNLDWQESRNGYITAESMTVDGLKIRIVVDPKDNEIITAYPVNVPRNPCPAAANDNRRN